MIWALLGFGIAVVIVLSWLCAHFAVTLSKTIQGALATTVALDERAQRDRDASRAQIQGLVDRLMSQNWEAVRAHELAQGTEEGGFFPPGEQSEPEGPPLLEQIMPKWGHASALRDFFDREADPGEALAEEDELDLLPEEHRT